MGESRMMSLQGFSPITYCSSDMNRISTCSKHHPSVPCDTALKNYDRLLPRQYLPSPLSPSFPPYCWRSSRNAYNFLNDSRLVHSLM